MGHLIGVRCNHTHHANRPSVRWKSTNGIGIDNQWDVGFNEFVDEFTDGVDGRTFSTQSGANQNSLTTATVENAI
jgi:hypothetical protein